MVVGHADEASLSECIAHCYWAVVAGVRRRAKERRGEFQFSRRQDFEWANYLVRLEKVAIKLPREEDKTSNDVTGHTQIFCEQQGIL